MAGCLTLRDSTTIYVFVFVSVSHTHTPSLCGLFLIVSFPTTNGFPDRMRAVPSIYTKDPDRRRERVRHISRNITAEV